MSYYEDYYSDWFSGSRIFDGFREKYYHSPAHNDKISRTCFLINKYKGEFTKICSSVTHDELLDIISYANQNNMDLSKDDSFPLRWAVHYNHTDLVELILKNPTIKISADSYYAVKKSLENQKTNISLMLLMDERTDISYNENMFFQYSIKYHNEKIINWLMHNPKFNIRIGLNDILKVAGDKGRTPIVKMCLEYDNIGLKNALSYSLINACRYGFFETAQLLLTSKYIDVSFDGNSAFSYAFSNRSDNLCQLLLSDERFDPSVSNFHIIKTLAGYKETEMIEKVFSNKNILKGDPNFLILDLEKYPHLIKMFLCKYNIQGKLHEDTIKKLVDLKIIPTYKSKVVERTL